MPKLVTRQRESRMDTYKKAVEELHGAEPLNPFKVLRLASGDTQLSVATSCGITKLSLLRLEQGVPVTPIESVVTYFQHQMSYKELTDSYYEYQKAMRHRHSRIFGPIPPVGHFAEPQNLTVHPFTLLLSRWTNPVTGENIGSLNPTEFAKLMCFPQSVGDHFLRKIARQQSVPKPLIGVLLDAGYSRTELDVLSKAYANYRNFTLHGEAPNLSEVVPTPDRKKTRQKVEQTQTGLLDAIKAEVSTL